MLRLISELGPEAAFDPDTVRIMAAAFDRAWGTLEAGGAPFSVGDYAERAREILARHIIQSARNGVRDQQQLCDGALLQLTRSDLTRVRSPSEEAVWRD
jgi:hypothetical protein